MAISISNHSDFPEKLQRCQEYIQALEEERRKIQVFQRELPLCLDLVTQAIETRKQQLSGTTTEYHLQGQSECSEQTSTPILEEFIPLKRSFSPHSDDDEEQESKRVKAVNDIRNENSGSEKNSKKSDWLISAQLWNETTPDPSSKEDSPRKVAVVEMSRDSGGGDGGGAFHPSKKENSSDDNIGNTTTSDHPAQGGAGQKSGSAPPASSSSTAETGGGGSKKEEKGEESKRKARRCWSPELHRRFEQALLQLGGSHVATPKQIRELMKFDGLTNDEVKSHLQKYRLHIRRPSPASQGNSHTPAPQFMVVGGIWVPPEYAAAMATATASCDATTANRIYAPIASLPLPLQGTSTDSPNKRCEGVAQSHSPATSSSKLV